MTVYTKHTLADSEEIKLLRISNRILQENSIPNGLDMNDKGQTLIFMLSSRTKQNIAQGDLDFIEKSGSLEDFQGFFKDEGARMLFNEILEHFVYCVKRKAVTQKDAEYLLS